ncbi:hypothetical protein Tco_0689284 [Tanacetum coccineum]
MVEPEPMKKMSKKYLLRLDEELAFKIQAKEEEEERLAREKAQQVEEANIAWDDVQAKIKANYQLAQRLQAQEQEELIDEEKKKLEEDKESEELKQCLEIVPDDVTIDATPLSTKSSTIVDYKIYKEGKKSYFQIIRADVQCVKMQSMLFYLLVEKMYPLTNHTLHKMFNDVKLQVDYECEMAFELLILVKKWLKEGYVPKSSV